MSPLLKSELRLRIGARHCVAEVWQAGLAARCVARVTVQDEPQSPVDAALNALAAKGMALPRRAVLLVEDELLYFATLPATKGLKQGLLAAREHFGSALPEQEMVVEVALLNDGRNWLATALPADLLDAWRLALSAHDVRLESAQLAIQQDLSTLLSAHPVRDGLVAIFGSEGVGFVTLNKAAVAALRWERHDLSDLAGLASRLQALQAECVAAANAPAAASELLLMPHSPAQATSLRSWAETNGWRLCAPALGPAE